MLLFSLIIPDRLTYSAHILGKVYLWYLTQSSEDDRLVHQYTQIVLSLGKLPKNQCTEYIALSVLKENFIALHHMRQE